MISIIFVLTFTCVIFFVLSIFQQNLPVPVLHLWNYSFGNTYIFTPSVAFQVWFWFTHFGVI